MPFSILVISESTEVYFSCRVKQEPKVFEPLGDKILSKAKNSQFSIFNSSLLIPHSSFLIPHSTFLSVFSFGDVFADREVALVATLGDEVLVEGLEYGAAWFVGVRAVAEATLF